MTTRAAVRDLLDRCDRLETLSDHCETLARLYRLPDRGRPQIEELLRGLVQSRLLVSEQELFSPGGHAGYGQGRISTIVIPTCNRPDGLRRCIDSFAINAREHGRKVRFRVLDDSPSPETRRANLEVLRQLRSTVERIELAGIRQKAEFIQRFSRAEKIPRDLLEFALLDPEGCKHKPGGNRNAALLDSITECAISIDDDIVCRVRPPPAQARGAYVTSHRDPTETWLLHPRQLEEAPGPDQVDFVGLHERTLGRSVHSILSQIPSSDVSYHVDRLLQLSMERRSARVLVSWTGFYGDSGASSANYYLWNPRTHREQLPSTRAALREIIEGRQIFRVTPRLTIGNGTYCQTIAYGFDNREVLPPFFPVFRGQDIIFGELLRSCVEDGAIAYLPWAVHHHPLETRENRRGMDDELAVHQVLTVCITSSQLPPHLGSPEARLVGLGQRLQEFATMRPSDFVAFIREETWRRRASLLGHLETWSGRHDNAELDTSMRRLISRLGSSLKRKREQRLLVSLGRGSEQEDVAFSQRLISRFGELLKAWPEIRKAMQRFKQDGAGIAVEVGQARA